MRYDNDTMMKEFVRNRKVGDQIAGNEKAALTERERK